jgi:hypothetical protein
MPEESGGNLTVEETGELEALEGQMADTHSWHQPSNQPTRDRVQALYRKQETGVLDDHRIGATGRRILEIEKLMADSNGEYWHSEKLQAEYRQLLEGKQVAPQGEAPQAPGEVLATWSESLGVTPEEMSAGFDRAQQIAAEIGDTSALDGAIEGLPDGLQRAIWVTLADPTRRLEQIDALSDEDFEELLFFWDSLAEGERAPIEHVLGIVA